MKLLWNIGILIEGILIGILLSQIGFKVNIAETADISIERHQDIKCSSHSMRPTFDCYDDIYTRKVSDDEILTIGKIYIYEIEEEDKRNIHRLIGCADEECTKLIFKGDNNLIADPIIDRSAVRDVVTKVIY